MTEQEIDDLGRKLNRARDRSSMIRNAEELLGAGPSGREDGVIIGRIVGVTTQEQHEEFLRVIYDRLRAQTEAAKAELAAL